MVGVSLCLLVVVVAVVAGWLHLAGVNEAGGDGTASNGRRLGAALAHARHTVSGGRVADGSTRGAALVRHSIAD